MDGLARQEEVEALLDLIRERNPAQYARFRERLRR